MKKIAIYNLIFISLLSLAFSGCDDKIDPLLNEVDPDRQFTPTGITTTNGQTQATIEWNAALFTEEGVSYLVEISKNQDFSIIEHSETVTTTQLIVTNQDITIKQDHYARIKAIGEDGRVDSGWALSGVFSITGEQIFLPVIEADLTNNSVNLKWVAGGTVTDIVVTPENGTPVNFELTTDEKTARARTITNLTPGTTYSAEIFNETTSRGSVSFTTFSLDVPDADRIIFLSETDVFSQTTFDTLTGSSVTFVFLQGSVYGTTAALVLKGSTDITFFGEPGANKPVMAFNGFTLPGAGGKIKFQNLDITGYEYIDGVPNTANKRGYIFNQSVASQTAEIAFDNCIIRNFANTPFRLQSANVITVGKFVANNCIVYDISAAQTYAFLHTNVATGKVDNIELTNSTFYNVRIGLILHNAAPSQSVTVSNNTVYDISDNTRSLIDYNAQSAGTFTFTANILSKVKTTDNTARGIRISGAGATVASSNYTTNDYTTVNNPIGGVTPYAGSSTDLFVSPSTGNFNFKDTSFAGKSTAGDPRWRQ